MLSEGKIVPTRDPQVAGDIRVCLSALRQQTDRPRQLSPSHVLTNFSHKILQHQFINASSIVQKNHDGHLTNSCSIMLLRDFYIDSQKPNMPTISFLKVH